MLEMQFTLLFIVAHIMFVAALAGIGRGPEWVLPLAALAAMLVFITLSFEAQQLQTVTDSGTVVTSEQPVLSIYALGAGLGSFVLAVVGALDWLPDLSGGASSGY